MQKNAFRFEVKSVDESGSFTGLASTYGNEDAGRDIVMPGAFTKTLADARGPFPLLSNHDVREQIGYVELQDTSAGLLVKGTLILHSERARMTYALMKAKALRGLSIGYDCLRSTMKGATRLLDELKLYEISVTPFPMNELATVTAVKDTSGDDAAVMRFRETLLSCTKQIQG
jgi:HK97 family phage prohead protease